MKYCGECGSGADEVAFLDFFRDQYKCSACLEQDPDYWRKKYYNLESGTLNLLARIHRDGGHHAQKAGLQQSLLDADSKVAGWIGTFEQTRCKYRIDGVLDPEGAHKHSDYVYLTADSDDEKAIKWFVAYVRDRIVNFYEDEHGLVKEALNE